MQTPKMLHVYQPLCGIYHYSGEMKHTLSRKIRTAIVIVMILFFMTAALVGQEQRLDIQIISPISVGETQVYPLGWSRQGHFAYIEAYDIGGLCGFCPMYNLVITSAVTDEVLATAKFDGSVIEGRNMCWASPLELYEREVKSIESLA